jgi:NTP pyrophosphatase (non-canonical NTP hydrolase)
MTLRELQQAIDQWIQGFEEGYWPPLANLARLTEEVGELAREVNHQFGPKKRRAGEPAGDLAAELGDVLFTVATLANSLGLDLSQIAADTLERTTTRDRDRWRRKGAASDLDGPTDDVAAPRSSDAS